MTQENLEYFPLGADAVDIIPEDMNAPFMDGYVTLSNGITLKENGDGRAYAEDGTEYVVCSVGRGENYGEGEWEEYEVLGWAEAHFRVINGLEYLTK